ncbi:MAG TPA: hypothetical protein VFO89_09445, partial [Thermoanaerobaculia bacterium]|nr:hypothetical protein [Thermoanaerobaculia bacterium]
RDPAKIRQIDYDTTANETSDLALIPGTPAHVVVATTRGLDWYRVDGETIDGLVAVTETSAPVSRVAANERWVAAAIGQEVIVYESRPSAATRITEYAFRNRVLALAFVSDVLYISVDREGTYVYEVPSAEWAAKLLPAPVSFARAGSVLWGASRDTGLTAIDVTAPAAPSILSHTGGGELFLDGVAAAGTRVFAFERDNRVQVFEAADPSSPSRIATLEEWTNVIAASGERVFLAGAVIDGEKLSSETGKPLRIFDARTLALLGEATDLAGPVSGVWTDGSLAYVVDRPYLRVLDVSKASEPRELASLLVPDIQDRIRVKNGLAVLYGRTHVILIDVSSPLRPRFLSAWDAQGHPPSTAMILSPGLIAEANLHSGFHVIDHRNYPQPVQIGGRIWHYLDAAASDDAAYLMLYGVLLTVEIRDQGRTVIDRKKYSILADQVDIVPPNASSPHALVARTPDGVRVYSLADRYAPMQTAFLPIARPGTMGTGDDDAYIAIDGILHRLKVATPSMLTPTAMKVMSPLQISVAGARVVVADRYSVRVFGPDTPSPVPPLKRKRRAAGNGG